MRWVIIMIVIVFDPLAIMMLLAATESMSWIKRQRLENKQQHIEVVPDTAPPISEVTTAEPFLEKIPETTSTITHFKDPGEHPKDYDETAAETCPKCNTALVYAPGIGPFCPNKQCDVVDNVYGTKDEQDFFAQARFAAQAIDIIDEQQRATEANAIISEIETEQNNDHETSTVLDEKQAQREWKDANPGKTLKQERARYDRGEIQELPWLQSLKLQADNVKVTGEVRGFGIEFPAEPQKGDQFIRVDVMPNKLYKYNGTKWIEVDKSLSDQYTFDSAYIDHLIEKLDRGEYDADLLSDAERDQIKFRLTSKG